MGPGEASGGRVTSLPGEEGSWLVCNVSRAGGKGLPDKDCCRPLAYDASLVGHL